MRLFGPTATAVPAGLKMTLFSAVRACVVGGVHVTPPSVVRSGVPAMSTITPVFASPNATAFRRSNVLVDPGTQLAPPSIVPRIVPARPTATPEVGLRNHTESSAWSVFAFCLNHPFGAGWGGTGPVAVSASSPHEVTANATTTDRARTRRAG